MSTEIQTLPDLTAAPTPKLLELSWFTDRAYEELAARVGQMQDDEIALTIQRTSEVGERAWWLRGMCVAEVRRRVRSRTEQERIAAVGTGAATVKPGATITAALGVIAHAAGTDIRTLVDDAKIVEALIPLLAEHDMTNEDVASSLIKLPEGLTRAVCAVIVRERDIERALEVATGLLDGEQAVTAQRLSNTLAALKSKELAEPGHTPSPSTGGNTTPPAPSYADCEWLNYPVSRGTKAILQKIQEKEGLPTGGQALEHAVRIAWDVISKRRSDARNAVK